MIKLIAEANEIPKNFTGMVEWTNGNKFWYKEGKLHRENGHAKEYASGIKCWYKEGKLHRENGPAIEYANGNKGWYKEGKLHRENGPAIEYADGVKYWYLNDVQYSEQEFNAEIAKRKNTCNGKVVTIDGKQYKLTELT